MLQRRQDTRRTLEEMSPCLSLLLVFPVLWSVARPLVSEPHCERQRELFSNGQNLWRLESLVKQVGDFASSRIADFYSRGEAPHDETAQVELRTVLWVVSDPLDDSFGQVVEASPASHAIGDRGLSRGGSFVRLVPVQEVGELRGRMLGRLCTSNPGRQAALDKRLFGSDADSYNPADKREPVVERDACTEDLRTCWIDTDETGTRFKTWRNVVLESTQETFSDSVVSGPATALTVCRKMLQNGG